MNAAAAADDAEQAALEKAKADAEFAKQQAAIDKAQAAADKKAQAEYERLLKKTAGTSRTSSRPQKSTIEQVLGIQDHSDPAERRDPRAVRHRTALTVRAGRR